MNKYRIQGIVLLLLGLVGNYYSTYGIVSFATGAMMVIGLIMAVTGKPFSYRKK